MTKPGSRRKSTDWRAIADSLHALTDDRQIEAALRRQCPQLVRHIQTDARRPALLRLWGQSLNRDEVTGTTIVAEPIIRTLSRLAGVPIDGVACHAGVLHTYGYLLSTIETPFGFKRDRWSSGVIESLAGLPTSTLQPQPRAGTLLANATYFLGRIAFRGRPRELAILRRQRGAVVPALLKHPYRPLRWTRITETARLSRSQTLELHTDLVPGRTPGDERLLLIYSTNSLPEKTKAPHAGLITAFPISAAEAAKLLDPARLGQSVPLRPRYNAFIPGLTGQAVAGERQAYAVTPAGISQVARQPGK